MVCLLEPDGLLRVSRKLLIYWDCHAQPSLGLKDNVSEKEKLSSERNFSGRKCLVDARCQSRMARLVGDDRKGTVAIITILYNQSLQETISE